MTREERIEIAARLQDLWHYSKRILDSQDSIFTGETQYRGMMGKCHAYQYLWESMFQHSSQWMQGLYYSLDMPRYPESELEMKVWAQRVLDQISVLEKNHFIDARKGEVLPIRF